MAMPPCGTFQYAGLVPKDMGRSGRWRLEDRSGAPPVGRFWFLRFLGGHSLRDDRLLGLRPTLEISDDHLILKASGRHRATVRAASLQLDPALIRVFQSGDVLNLVRTLTAHTGVSLLRGRQLVFAVGAVTALPLGGAVTVRTGFDREPSAFDADPWPSLNAWVDVSVPGNSSRLREDETTAIGDYRFSVLNCYRRGIPGTYERLAISLEHACPHDASLRSAQRLARPGLAMTDWR